MIFLGIWVDFLGSGEFFGWLVWFSSSGFEVLLVEVVFWVVGGGVFVVV